MDFNLGLKREFEFTDQHFSKVKEDLYGYAGIVLADHKKDMAYNRLVRRVRALGLLSFDSYFTYISSNQSEFEQFINALTTNLSSFFRENHHFSYIKSNILPDMRASGQDKIRVWSAGCSHGEEAYSIAMTLHDALLNINQVDVKILATDIDSTVLSTAQLGVYDIASMEGLFAQSVQKYFLKGVGVREGKVQIRQELKEIVDFKFLNLMNEWPMQGRFDFIFCRNVMIYFNKETQQYLVEKFAQYLKPGGYLFVGHSEALGFQQRKFKLIGKTIYQFQSTP
ncbi:MAG: protein-glutamate O-methyltransferase CheR [Oceanospirillaceae bacterium]|nr:protein-glutamate O-methyltransferase CheR [Oceanospirillaceae bacterium]